MKPEKNRGRKRRSPEPPKDRKLPTRKIEMVPFDRENDLKIKKHDVLIRTLTKTLKQKPKDVRRFRLDVVKQEITNLCEKTMHSIQGDLSALRLNVDQGKSYLEKMLGKFDKEQLEQKYAKDHLRSTLEAIQEDRNKLTEYVKTQKAKRHLLLEQLKQLKHETNDILFEKYKGKTPQKFWYNR